jgi:hypothetical protein
MAAICCLRRVFVPRYGYGLVASRVGTGKDAISCIGLTEAHRACPLLSNSGQRGRGRIVR